MTLAILQEMKEKDPGMEVKFKVDMDGKIMSMVNLHHKHKHYD